LTKTEKRWTLKDGDFQTHYFFAIEDPFEITHNLARNSELNEIIGIRKEFGRAYTMTTSGKPLGMICKIYNANPNNKQTEKVENNTENVETQSV